MKQLMYNGKPVTLVRERAGVAELFDSECNIHLVPVEQLDYSTLTQVEKRLVPSSKLLHERPENWLTEWRQRRLEIVSANIKTRKVEKSAAGEQGTKPKRRSKVNSDEALMAKAAEMLRRKMLGAT